MLLQDLRYSLRLLRRTPGFTAVAVVVLALGIGANTAVFSLVNALLLRPMPGRIAELVGVFNRDRTKPDGFRGFSYPAYTDIRDHNDVFDSVMAHTLSLVGIREGNSTRRSFAAVVSSNYFTTLGVPLAAGRAFSLEEERPGAVMPVAIASDGLWRRAGGQPAFLGSTIVVNATSFTIVGIAPPGFTGTMAIVDGVAIDGHETFHSVFDIKGGFLFFKVNDRFVLADLPGYGYAKVSKTRQAEWLPLIEGYLRTSAALRGVVQLLDVRHHPSDEDLQMRRRRSWC